MTPAPMASYPSFWMGPQMPMPLPMNTPRLNHHFQTCYNKGKDLGGCSLHYDRKHHVMTVRFDRDPQRIYVLKRGGLDPRVMR